MMIDTGDATCNDDCDYTDDAGTGDDTSDDDGDDDGDDNGSEGGDNDCGDIDAVGL